MADAESALKKLLSVYAQMSREEQRECAAELFAECDKTPEEMQAIAAEYRARYGKSIRDIAVEWACSEELSEQEVSEAMDLVSAMDELAGQSTKVTQ